MLVEIDLGGRGTISDVFFTKMTDDLLSSRVCAGVCEWADPDTERAERRGDTTKISPLPTPTIKIQEARSKSAAH